MSRDTSQGTTAQGTTAQATTAKGRMSPAARNLLVWLAAAVIVGTVWLVAARPRLHFIDPASFLLILAAAAAALTALLWWEIAGGSDDTDAASPATEAPPRAPLQPDSEGEQP